ncbi:alpha/beta-hydrolase [Hyaloscypha variabilis F]|uniref:Alpha/beta-hydrolase n=1 Tax=Hyaloscypha variabilis (strain UAMH 11265 / GT02V1 / F) TaxID=1149755 RepID=A0A2J6RX63_HYAVF|nr:alpha/beta-hydrolase [Hyaloscypha variabilis F]
MADFSELARPSKEWQHHVEVYGTPLPAPIGKMSPVAMQKSTNDGRDEASSRQIIEEGLSSAVATQTVYITARDNYLIPTRIYTPRAQAGILPIYIFYHGGGFIYGTLDSEDAACCRIVEAMDVLVISICYGHTPQYAFPAAHNDALDAFDWIVDNAEGFRGDLSKVILGGISAGANLAVHVVLSRSTSCHNSNDGFCVQGLVLGIPWLIINSEKFPYDEFVSKEKASRLQCSEAPVVSQTVLDFFVGLMGEKVNDDSVRVNPDVVLKDSETLGKLPSTAIMVAGNDPLRDDGLLLAMKLHQIGVPVKVHAFPGLPHGFRRFNDLPSSHRWDELVVENIKWSLEKKKGKVSGNMKL